MAFGDLLDQDGDVECRGALISVTAGRSPLVASDAAFGLAEGRSEDRYRLETLDGPVLTAVRPALHVVGFAAVRAEPHPGVANPSALVRDLMAATVVPFKLAWLGYGWDEPMWRWATPVAPTLVNDWDQDTQITGLTNWRLTWECADTTVHVL